MNFFVTGGTMRNDANSYVQRRADHELYDALLRGEFCYILTSRQMGKSSLMVRTAGRLRSEANIATILLDLTEIGSDNITAEQWYFGLLDSIAQPLELEDELEDFWNKNEKLSALKRLLRAITDVVLPELEARNQGKTSETGSPVRLTLFVDEIDIVRTLPFQTDEFFAGIRECFNRRSREPRLEALTFCLIGVASPSDLISDPLTTPFNVGTRIALRDFTDEEAQAFQDGLVLGGPNDALAQVYLKRILYWTGGHPYLTQTLCHAVAKDLDNTDSDSDAAKVGPANLVDQICFDLFLGGQSREHDDNFIFVRERLLRHQINVGRALTLYRTVLRGKRVRTDELDPEIRELQLSGLVRIQNDRLAVRNRLYANVFNLEWITENMPEAELRRERELNRRRMTRALSLAALLIVGAAGLYLRINQTILNGLFPRIQSELASRQLGARHAARELLDEAKSRAILPSDRERVRRVSTDWITAQDAKALSSLRFFAAADTVRLSQSGTQIAIGNSTGLLTVWDLDEQNRRKNPRTHQFKHGITRIRWSPADRFLTVAYGSGAASLTDVVVASNCKLFTPAPLPAADGVAAFSPNGRSVTYGVVDPLETGDALWSFKLERRESEKLYELPDSRNPIACLAYSADGDQLAFAHEADLDVTLLRLQPGYENWWQPEPIEFSFDSSPSFLVWHPSGAQLLVGTETGNIYRCDPQQGSQELFQRTGNAGTHVQLAISPNGLTTAALCSDARFRIWRSHEEQEWGSAVTIDASGLQIHRDNRLLSYRGSDPQTGLPFLARYELSNDRSLRTFYLPKSPNAPTKLLFTQSNLLFAARGGGIRVWDVENREGSGAAAYIPMKQIEGLAIGFPENSLVTSGAMGCYEIPFETEGPPENRTILFQQPVIKRLPTALSDAAMTLPNLAAVVHNGAKSDHVHLFAPRDDFPQVLFDFGDHLSGVELSAQGTWLFAACADKAQIHVQKIRNPFEDPNRFEIEGSGHFAVDPKERWLAVNAAGQLRLHPLGPTIMKYTFVATVTRRDSHQVPLAMTSLQGSGRTLLAASLESHSFQIFEIPQSTPELPIKLFDIPLPPEVHLTELCFSTDGTRIAGATQADVIYLWNLPRLAKLQADLGFPAPLAPNLDSLAPSWTRTRFQHEIDEKLLYGHHELAPDIVSRAETAWFEMQAEATASPSGKANDSQVRYQNALDELGVSDGFQAGTSIDTLVREP